MVRHASASRADIRLYGENGRFVLEIEDDGQGFDLETIVPGFGIQAMGKHTRMLDAIMTVNSEPGKGTVVVVKSMEQHSV